MYCDWRTLTRERKMPVIITKNKEEKNLGPLDVLPQTKNKNGYDYNLVKRNDKVAMYAMQNPEIPEDNGYEVFKIVESKPSTLLQKSGVKKGMWYQYPAMEKFPGNEDFGNIAWAFNTIESAEKKFKELSK